MIAVAQIGRGFAMTAQKSGSEIGAENVGRLKNYLDSLRQEGRKLPERGGKANISAIALACGFDRQVFYQNPAAKRLLDDAIEHLGLAEVVSDEKPIPRSDRRDQRILTLEQQNASLRAENAGLREKLRHLEQVEEIMIESGRRISR
jgi:signal recognition particle subunit SEC65